MKNIQIYHFWNFIANVCILSRILHRTVKNTRMRIQRVERTSTKHEQSAYVVCKLCLLRWGGLMPHYTARISSDMLVGGLFGSLGYAVLYEAH